MRALCVDDEAILLEVLKRSVEASPDVCSVAGFQSAREALEWAEENPIDVAFLDIQIPQMSGLELAEHLREIYPALPVVFCTGYDSYAREAFKVHAAGYLSKPIYQADVQEQIDEIKKIVGGFAPEAKKLEVKCFGNFEVFMDGKPLPFKRKKSKEIFAYLIDRQGAVVSVEQMEAALWEDEIGDRNLRNYFHQLLHHLKAVLKDAGMEDVIIGNADGYAVNKNLINCDYYRYLEGDEAAYKLFHNEYMYQYSWAEDTCGELIMERYAD